VTDEERRRAWLARARPCRCDQCGTVEEHAIPGEEHWHTILGASWRRPTQHDPKGIQRGIILRRCRKRGTLVALDPAPGAEVA
jgi:hypothetical protein